MELEALKLVIDNIDGAAFATLDTTTYPIKELVSVYKVTTGTRVLLFTNKDGVSGYGELVKRRLTEAGKDPRDFVLGDLPWGERIPNSPLIVHRGLVYLQAIVLQPGLSIGYQGNREIDLDGIVPSRRTNQGLSKQDEVVVSTYRIDHIDRISLVGETMIVADAQGLVPLG